MIVILSITAEVVLHYVAATELDSELSRWLEAVVPSPSYAPPIINCKAIIAPSVEFHPLVLTNVVLAR
jgi:hypothetical protein